MQKLDVFKVEFSIAGLFLKIVQLSFSFLGVRHDFIDQQNVKTKQEFISAIILFL